MYAESDLLPISALQHLLFCERQCALIHVERVWAENRLTVEGAHLHEKAHGGGPETRDGVRVTRSLPLRHLELGLSGVADVVLFEPPEDTAGEPPEDAGPRGPVASLLRESSAEQLARWTVTPVEYKRGKPKADDSDRVQLCAQALCLEEMLGVRIERGELFYGKRRRRTEVPLDSALRERTAAASRRLHEIIDSGITPPARREPKCDNCSLVEICLPDAVGRAGTASTFFDRSLEKHLGAAGPATDPFDSADG